MATIKEKILDWYMNGETGVSSEAMARAVVGAEPSKTWGAEHPYDYGDFMRCHKFLEAVPEAREHMDKVAALSKQWAVLVEHWDELEALVDDRALLNARLRGLEI